MFDFNIRFNCNVFHVLTKILFSIQGTQILISLYVCVFHQCCVVSAQPAVVTFGGREACDQRQFVLESVQLQFCLVVCYALFTIALPRLRCCLLADYAI